MRLKFVKADRVSFKKPFVIDEYVPIIVVSAGQKRIAMQKLSVVYL